MASPPMHKAASRRRAPLYNSPAAGAEGLTASLTPCRLKPKESWVGEMVIRLHEPAEGDMAPEEEEEEEEADG
jgi:hypothetical protein